MAFDKCMFCNEGLLFVDKLKEGSLTAVTSAVIALVTAKDSDSICKSRSISSLNSLVAQGTCKLVTVTPSFMGKEVNVFFRGYHETLDTPFTFHTVYLFLTFTYSTGTLSTTEEQVSIAACLSDEPVVLTENTPFTINLEETNNVVTIRADFDGSVTQGVLIENYYTKTQVESLLNTKQDVLTAGDGVSISNNVVKTTGIPFGICDGTSTNTAFTVTVPGIYKLEDGVTCMVKNGVATSRSGFTLNVNGLGAKPVYNNMAASTAETTIFNVNYTMLFVYDSTRVSGGCWICYRGYAPTTDNDSNGLYLRAPYCYLPASDTFGYNKILFTSADNTKWVPSSASTTNSSTTILTVNQRPINPFGRIVCYKATATITQGNTVPRDNVYDQNNIILGYAFNTTGSAWDLTVYSPVYVKCTPQTDGSAIIDSVEPIVQALPNSADGKIYIFLGIVTAATSLDVLFSHPVYYHDGTGIRLWRGNAVYSKSEVDTLLNSYVTTNTVQTIGASKTFSSSSGNTIVRGSGITSYSASPTYDDVMTGTTLNPDGLTVSTQYAKITNNLDLYDGEKSTLEFGVYTHPENENDNYLDSAFSLIQQSCDALEITFASDSAHQTCICTYTGSGVDFHKRKDVYLPDYNHIWIAEVPEVSSNTSILLSMYLRAYAEAKTSGGVSYVPLSGNVTELIKATSTTAILPQGTTSTINLGSSSSKFNTIYASTFNGNATSATSATSATQDGAGNVITNTYVDRTTNQTVAGNKEFSDEIISDTVIHALGDGEECGIRLCDGLQYESRAYCSITGYEDMDDSKSAKLIFYFVNSEDGVSYNIVFTGPNTNTSGQETLTTIPMTTETWSLGSNDHKLGDIYAKEFHGNLDGTASSASYADEAFSASLAEEAERASKDGSGNTITATYGNSLRTYARTYGSYGSTSNQYIELYSKGSSSLGRVYISDIIANALRGCGGFGWGTQLATSARNEGYSTTQSFGSVGSLGLFSFVNTSSNPIIPGTGTISGSSLKFVALYKTSVSISSDVILETIEPSSSFSGTWYVLSYVVPKFSTASDRAQIVLAVRIL